MGPVLSGSLGNNSLCQVIWPGAHPSTIKTRIPSVAGTSCTGSKCHTHDRNNSAMSLSRSLSLRLHCKLVFMDQVSLPTPRTCGHSCPFFQTASSAAMCNVQLYNYKGV